MSKDLLDEIKNSIEGMQEKMRDTYSHLEATEISGESHDKTVEIIMTASYSLVDIKFDERALQGGIKEFKWRIREAWKNLCSEIQKTTQSKTMELLQGMQIPDEIKQLSANQTDATSGDTDKE